MALIVFGPRKLPEIGKSMGKMLAEFRKASNDFKRTIEDEVEAEKIPGARSPRRPLPPPRPPTAAVPRPRGSRAEGRPSAPRRRGPTPIEPEVAATVDGRQSPPSPDRMTFLEHLEELRVRLIRSLVALVVGFAVCWGFHERIFHFLTQPLRKAYPASSSSPPGPSEAFMLYMKMAFFVGIFLAAPYILYQVWAFIAPGLYAHEKAYAVPFIVVGTLFFLGRRGLRPLRPLPHHLPLPRPSSAATDMQFLPKVDEYYSFYSWFLLGLGLVFQLPVVIFVLARIGLVTPGFLLRQFKYAVLAVVRPLRRHHAHARTCVPDDARRSR